jgi:peptidoglycan/xylan/chitin deacetylase (PgdA/CDA1 family)
VRRGRVAAGLLTLVLAGCGGGSLGHSAQRHPTLLAGVPHPARVALPHRLGLRGRQNPELRRLIRLGLPIYCAGPRGREVAFTFDDGPGVYTHYALHKLRQWHEQATFFVVGKSINSWPRWLAPERRLGAIGDHTYTHPDLRELPLGQVTDQLARTARLILARSGVRVELWRPPYGAADPAIDAIARRMGLLEIRWDVDSRDWAGASWSQIIQIVEAGLRPGAIVLMHENHGQTIRALTTLLPYLHRHHLRSVTIPELLASDPPSVAQVRRGEAGCGAGRAAAPGGH